MYLGIGWSINLNNNNSLQENTGMCREWRAMDESDGILVCARMSPTVCERHVLVTQKEEKKEGRSTRIFVGWIIFFKFFFSFWYI